VPSPPKLKKKITAFFKRDEIKPLTPPPPKKKKL